MGCRPWEPVYRRNASFGSWHSRFSWLQQGVSIFGLPAVSYTAVCPPPLLKMTKKRHPVPPFIRMTRKTLAQTANRRGVADAVRVQETTRVEPVAAVVESGADMDGGLGKDVDGDVAVITEGQATEADLATKSLGATGLMTRVTAQPLPEERETPVRDGGGATPAQPTQAQPRTWANLFRNNRCTNDTSKLDQYERTGKTVPIAADDVEELDGIMGPCLVGCFMGRHPGRQGVEAISRRWGVPNNYHLHTSGWVVFKFDKDSDKEAILLGGPYFVFGIPLFLKHMPKCFLFAEDGRYVPAWVQLHGLPPDC